MKLILVLSILISFNIHSQEFYKLDTANGSSCISFDKRGEPISVCKVSKDGNCLYNSKIGCHLGSGQKIKPLNTKDKELKTPTWTKANFTPEIVGEVKRVNKCTVTVRHRKGMYISYPKVVFSGIVKRNQKVSSRIDPAIFVRYVTPLTLAGQDLGGGVDSRGQDLGGGVDSRGQDLGGGVDSKSCSFSPSFVLYNFLDQIDDLLMLRITNNKF